MTPERWRQIESLYHAALDRTAAERAAFLHDACGADEALRREIESLFDVEPRAKDFMERPASDRLAGAVRRLEPDPAPVPGRFVGRVFGAYEVQTLIAAGGMGEVYRAVDTRLTRTVALKTLPGHLSHDPERRARFMHEARIVSSLNHPHICALYDVGVEDDIPYLVMEHIDGDTLQQRLAQGRLPPARALDYAIQIADALDKAHRRGIVHRDLKPANVMLTRSGVKLLDFGLALVRAPAAVAGFDEDGRDGAPGLTAEGAIVGTLQYISPEQLEGKPADMRTDIFAFGALAYEMITGTTAFAGSSRAQLVGAILKDAPRPIAGIVPDVSPRLVETLSRCLAKDPEDRWQSAGDLLFELRAIAHRPASDVARPRGVPRVVERALWVAAVIACVAATLLWTRRREGPPDVATAAAPAIRFTLSPAEGTALSSVSGVPFALSPDGRQIVYAAVRADGSEQLWLRSLYSHLEQPLPGTENANTPFWSPDSQWIGFFSGNSLKKLRVSSGLTQVVAANVQTRGGATWSAHDVIVFTAGRGGLSRVSADGGAVSATTTASEGSHFWPQFLGDGTHFIYAGASTGSIHLGSLGPEPPRILMKFAVRISALAYVPGYVFFVQDAALFARPFDERRLEFSGEATRLVEGVPVMGPGRAPFSVSASGVLAYWPYPVGTAAALRWFDRSGRASAGVDSPAIYNGFTLSPDARQVAFARAGGSGGSDVWIRDLGNGHESRVTFDGAAFTPQWSPDGTRLAFTGAGEKPPLKLFVKHLASEDVAVQVGVSNRANFASGWSGHGGAIVSVRTDPVSRNDLWVHRLADKVDERLSFDTEFNESHGRVSPDDRWIAYDTDASGRREVWVASFPSGAIRRRVSAGGGSSPEWGEGSTEVIYLSDDKRLMSARLGGEPGAVEVSAPRALFPVPTVAEVDQSAFPGSSIYVVASNGQRFLVAVRVPDPRAPPINIVVNWRARLAR